MELSNEQQQRIDDYLAGRMDPAGEAEFEAILREDSDLHGEVTFQWKLRQAGMRQRVGDFHDKYGTAAPPGKDFRKWWWLALLVVAVAGIFYFQSRSSTSGSDGGEKDKNPNPRPNGTVQTDTGSVSPKVVQAPPRANPYGKVLAEWRDKYVKEDFPVSGTRGADKQSGENLRLQQARLAFEQHDWAKAFKLYGQIPTLDKWPDDALRQGYAAMRAGNTEEAIIIFRILDNADKYDVADAAHWYLILTYLSDMKTHQADYDAAMSSAFLSKEMGKKYKSRILELSKAVESAKPR